MNNKPCEERKFYSFSDAVNWHLKDKHLKQSDLIRKGNLSRTTVSRICRNSNDKGKFYLPTYRMVMTVCVALKLGKEETEEMFEAAFPEITVWKEIIDKRMNIMQANYLLDEKGYDLLGYVTEE